MNDGTTSIRCKFAKLFERAFRDAKCPRFGWALKYTGSKSLLRLDALLLIAAFAIAAVLLIGAAAVQTGIEKSLRASSKHGQQLSFFTVGYYMLALRIQIPFNSVWKQFKRIRRENAALFPRLIPPRSSNRNVRFHFRTLLFCTDCGWNGSQYGWPQ